MRMSILEMSILDGCVNSAGFHVIQRYVVTVGMIGLEEGHTSHSVSEIFHIFQILYPFHIFYAFNLKFVNCRPLSVLPWNKFPNVLLFFVKKYVDVTKIIYHCFRMKTDKDKTGFHHVRI
jgi:hypothetical protein